MCRACGAIRHRCQPRCPLFFAFERQLRVQCNRLLLPVGAKNVASISFLRVVVRFPRSKRAEFDTTSPIFIACPQTLCTFEDHVLNGINC